jgi:uncharacterized protein (TIGR02453 family)
VRFRGWPEEALGFYRGLEADNSKSYWTAHRDVYEASVLAPMQALGEAVAEEFGLLRIFRPYRDVRFSADKTPYKTAIGAAAETEGGAVVYVQLSADGLFAASGYYQPAADQLDKYRRAVADERSGPVLERVVDELRAGGWDVGGEALRVAPRGYPRDHPRVALLRHKGVTMGKAFPPAKWLHSAKALDRVVGTWRAAAPLNRWLDDHVGPSTLPPPEAR